MRQPILFYYSFLNPFTLELFISMIAVNEMGSPRPADHTTSNLLPGIPCRLSCEIVWCTMDNQRPSNNIVYPKPPSQDGHFRFSLIGQQGWKITGMIGMKCAGWVVMPSGIGKIRTATAFSFMDMERKETVSR